MFRVVRKCCASLLVLGHVMDAEKINNSRFASLQQLLTVMVSRNPLPTTPIPYFDSCSLRPSPLPFPPSPPLSPLSPPLPPLPSSVLGLGLALLFGGTRAGSWAPPRPAVLGRAGAGEVQGWEGWRVPAH